MRRRISLILLAALVALPVVSPASAAEPTAVPDPTDLVLEMTPSPEPSVDPSAAPSEAPSAPPTESPSAPPSTAPSTAPESGAPSATPSAEATVDPSTEPSTEPSDEPIDTETDDTRGIPDVDGRYIVVLKSGSDTEAVVERHGRRDKVRADRSFTRGVRGFAAKLTKAQRRALEADPTVLAIVPDEVIELQAQTIPNGIRRIGGRSSAAASINGTDQRVDADVAIVDTGIQPNHPDLNVVGGYNCSTSDRKAWRDVNGHGTHVAGTVGALDNSYGVVGVAPGARLYAVKILNDDGYGLLSWYVCGLDWILAQRDPNDSSRPLFESVNMSVAKAGTSDKNCGATSNDVLHAAICRLVAGGIPVVAAAGNNQRNAANYVPAAYAETITVSALADTDGKPGGLGGNSCYSWGGYDKDDTFADFSNYGKIVDIIAPGKCIWSTLPGSRYGYSSGTSMATPAVAGAIALYKASRPNATIAETKEALQYLGNLGWDTKTDPDAYNEKLLDVAKIGPLGSFTLAASTGTVSDKGGSVLVPITINRSTTFFERVALKVSKVPSGWTATLDKPSVMGWTAKSAVLNVTVPAGTKAGTYALTVTGTNQGRTRSTDVTVTVGSTKPIVQTPSVELRSGVNLGSTIAGRIRWAAASGPSTITGYQWQFRKVGGSWSSSYSTAATTRAASKVLSVGVGYQFRIRAKDSTGTWSDWATTGTVVGSLVNDRSSAITYKGTWSKAASKPATSGTLMTSKANGATARYTATGRGLAVVAPITKTRGWLEIRVDGALEAKVSLQSSTTIHRRVIWAKDFGSSATRIVELKVVTSSTRPVASLDGLIVLR